MSTRLVGLSILLFLAVMLALPARAKEVFVFLQKDIKWSSEHNGRTAFGKVIIADDNHRVLVLITHFLRQPRDKFAYLELKAGYLLYGGVMSISPDDTLKLTSKLLEAYKLLPPKGYHTYDETFDVLRMEGAIVGPYRQNMHQNDQTFESNHDLRISAQEMQRFWLVYSKMQ
jgi:hypothetical protein